MIFRPYRVASFFLVLTQLISFGVAAGSPADSPTIDLKLIQSQLNKIKSDEAAERSRVNNDEQTIRLDEQTIRLLEQQLKSINARDAELVNKDQQLELNHIQLKTQTEQQIQEVKAQVDKGVSQSEFASDFGRYLGSHQFTWNGAVAGDFIYDRGNNTNTFALTVQPLVIYRLNDWMSFEGEIEASFPQGSGASFDLGIGMFQLFLSDYVQINAGIFDQPFGDWYEAQSPVWVNRFITAPVLYGAQAIIPPSEIGVQLRGGVQWGSLGQDFDYTSWVGNGPTFDSSLPQPVVGQAFNPVTNISSTTNGKAFGTRLRFYPFPLESNLGRLELGASTLDGKWQNGLWFNSWGVDYAYLNGNLQTRGEYVQTYRQMPANSSADNRQGWYVQAGYFLQGLHVPHLPFDLEDQIHKLEPLVRYSGVNQRAVVVDEISTSPEVGFSGSPSIFAPHSREVALALDYWIEPSIVWQTEFDLELPRAEGTLLSFNGKNQPSAQGVGATPNDRAILTQLAIGF
jgi:hypothetical protein